MSKLYAGAGRAQIEYTQEMLPNYGENYTGIHDCPCMQMLLLKSETASVALISVDVVILDIGPQMREEAAGLLGLPEDQILIHATHILSTPHFAAWESEEQWRTAHSHFGGEVLSEEEIRTFVTRDRAIAQVHLAALRQICRQAAASLQPATVRYSEAFAPVNVNRKIQTQEGYLQGTNFEGPSDHTVPVVRIDGVNGAPLAIWYNCNTAPGCLEFSMNDGSGKGRLISGDLAGASERFIEKMYANTVVPIYTTGYTGDQWQALRARADYLDADGKQIVTDLGEDGLILPRLLGMRLGEQVVRAAGAAAELLHAEGLRLKRMSFEYDAFGGPDSAPVKRPVETAQIALLQIGELCVVFCGVEIGSETFREIQGASPYTHTFVMEFTTPGGGYLPTQDYYDHHGAQAYKTHFARGTAERFAQDVSSALRTLYEEGETGS